jgi:hypothetical protein
MSIENNNVFAANTNVFEEFSVHSLPNILTSISQLLQVSAEDFGVLFGMAETYFPNTASQIPLDIVEGRDFGALFM